MFRGSVIITVRRVVATTYGTAPYDSFVQIGLFLRYTTELPNGVSNGANIVFTLFALTLLHTRNRRQRKNVIGSDNCNVEVALPVIFVRRNRFVTVVLFVSRFATGIQPNK